MCPSRAINNQQAFDMYRRAIESGLARPTPIMDTSPVWSRHTQIATQWMARYSRRRDFIQGEEGWGHKLADAAAVEALLARNLAREAELPQLPAWDEMTLKMIDMSLKHVSQQNRLDVSSLAEPCRFGPSLRRLWGEAKARGLSDDEAWVAIYDWANHRPPAWKTDDDKKRRKPSPQEAGLGKRLESTVTWTKTRDLDYPWEADVQGGRWQVRINDFPDEHMYTMLMNGSSVGDFDDWPEAWDRGDRPRAKAHPQAPAVIAVKGRFLERYMAGEYEAVWAELVSLGPGVRDPQFMPEAVAVAQETMRRARQNVELLIQRLDKMEYRFWNGGKGSGGKASNHLKDKDVYLPPSPHEKQELAEFERGGRVLPLSLRIWMEEVGRVDLAGSHPALSFLVHEDGFPGIYADPLMVIPNADSLEDMLGLGGESENDLFISYDASDKAAVGTDEQLDSDYWMDVPNLAADGLLKGYPHEITFVEYLRLSFRWGGFPGWKDQAHRPERELSVLTEGLLPL